MATTKSEPMMTPAQPQLPIQSFPHLLGLYILQPRVSARSALLHLYQEPQNCMTMLTDTPPPRAKEANGSTYPKALAAYLRAPVANQHLTPERSAVTSVQTDSKPWNRAPRGSPTPHSPRTVTTADQHNSACKLTCDLSFYGFPKAVLRRVNFFLFFFLDSLTSYGVFCLPVDVSSRGTFLF